MGNSKASSAQRLVRKVFRPVKGERWDKDELLDALFWMRVFIAIMWGISWGAVPLMGLYAFAGYVISSTVLLLWWQRIQEIDEDDYGGLMTLVQEGFAPAMAVFILCWTLTYSLLHG